MRISMIAPLLRKPVPTFSRDAHFDDRTAFAKNRFPLFRAMLYGRGFPFLTG
jgi:hypothetical protein